MPKYGVKYFAVRLMNVTKIEICLKDEKYNFIIYKVQNLIKSSCEWVKV